MVLAPRQPAGLSPAGVGDVSDPEPGEFVLGGEVEQGEHPQILLPGGYLQAAGPQRAEPVLVSCVIAPGFDFSDVWILSE